MEAKAYSFTHRTILSGSIDLWATDSDFVLGPEQSSHRVRQQQHAPYRPVLRSRDW
jgi:hypothetical protein